MSKRIRDLDQFSEAAPLNTGDYLIVADIDTQVTRRSTIKDVVGSYNVSVVEEQEALPDTVTVIDPDTGAETEISNPLKDIVTKVEHVDTDGDGVADEEILVDTTPITSENLDKLVKPGGGLEIIEVCKNESGAAVPCTIISNGVEVPNTEVALKSKQLSFAVSEASKNIIIKVNASGERYSSSSSYSFDQTGQVDTTFSKLTDAYRFIRDKIPSKDSSVTIYVTSDIVEDFLGPTNSSTADGKPIIGQGAFMTNGIFNVSVIGWDDTNNRNCIESGTLRKIEIKRKEILPLPQAMLWMNSQRDVFMGIHFCVDNTEHRGSHTIFRSDGGIGNNLIFYTCKLSYRGSTFQVFEASRGGSIAFHNYSDSLEDQDPLSKGFWVPGMEFDFSPYTGGETYADIFYGLDAGGSIRDVEYSPHAPFESNPSTHWQNRTHFSNCANLHLKHFLHLSSSSLFDINSPMTADHDGDIFNYTGGNSGVIHAFGFNTLTFSQSNQPDGTAENLGFGRDASTSLYSSTINEGIDYRASYGGSLDPDSMLDFVRVQKNAGGSVNLSNYWPNHTNWREEANF